MFNLITKKMLGEKIKSVTVSIDGYFRDVVRPEIIKVFNAHDDLVDEVEKLTKEVNQLKSNMVVFVEDTQRYVPCYMGKKIHLLDVSGDFIKKIRVENHEYDVARETKTGKIKFLKEVVKVTYE